MDIEETERIILSQSDGYSAEMKALVKWICVMMIDTATPLSTYCTKSNSKDISDISYNRKQICHLEYDFGIIINLSPELFTVFCIRECINTFLYGISDI